jgi:hypothetical protein
VRKTRRTCGRRICCTKLGKAALADTIREEKLQLRRRRSTRKAAEEEDLGRTSISQEGEGGDVRKKADCLDCVVRTITHVSEHVEIHASCRFALLLVLELKHVMINSTKKLTRWEMRFREESKMSS